MNDAFIDLFAFNRWATNRSLDACRLVSPEDYVRPFPGGVVSLHATVTHVAGATMAWAKRIAGERVTALPTEAEVPTLNDAIVLAQEAQAAFDQLVMMLSFEQLNAILTYHNLAGVEKRLPLWAVLRHVVNHASYHRGQISTKLKAFGIVAPSTDFIAWAYEQTNQA